MREVIVIGDVIVDITKDCQVVGPSAENPNALVLSERSTGFSLGGAGNVANNVQSLGLASCCLLGPVAQNAAAQIDGLCEAVGLRHVLDPLEDWAGTYKTRYYTSGGLALRIDRQWLNQLPENYWDPDRRFVGAPWHLKAKNDEQSPPPVVCLVNYDKGVFNPGTEAKKLGSLLSPKAIVIADPGRYGQWGLTAHRDSLIRANVVQCRAFARQATSGAATMHQWFDKCVHFDPGQVYARDMYLALGRHMQYLLSDFNCSYLVVTLGAGGLMAVPCHKQAYCRDDQMPILISAPQVGTVDPCGAGDTVTATLASSLAAAETYDFNAVVRACCYAVQAAAVAVQHRGVYAVTAEDWQAHCNHDES